MDVTLLGELAERDAFTMGEVKAEGSDRNEGDEPEHDPATDGEFLAESEDGRGEDANYCELGAAADSGELNDGTGHAGAHDEEDVTQSHVLEGGIGVRHLEIRGADQEPDSE